MKKSYILTIDQGTTGSRALLYDSNAVLRSSAYQEFRQYYPRPGWVEHDANEIFKSVTNVIRRALEQARISSAQIVAIGITNQRETAVLWDRRSGNPLARAIVWQDRRTDSLCQELKKQGHEPSVRKKTGLLCDPYFSGTKLRWFLDHHSSLRRRAKAGTVAFGTIDSLLLYRLTGKSVHATDFTNASRTLLFNIRTKKWDRELCRLIHVPETLLPEAKLSNSFFGATKNCPPLVNGIPIYALMGETSGDRKSTRLNSSH